MGLSGCGFCWRERGVRTTNHVKPDTARKAKRGYERGALTRRDAGLSENNALCSASCLWERGARAHEIGSKMSDAYRVAFGNARLTDS